MDKKLVTVPKLKFDAEIGFKDPVEMLKNKHDITELAVNALDNWRDYYHSRVGEPLYEISEEFGEAYEKTWAEDWLKTGALSVNENGISYDKEYPDNEYFVFRVPCELDIDKFKEAFVEKNKEADEHDR